MARYDAAADRETSVRIVRVKLDGKVIFERGAPDNEFIKACDTDEGWVEAFETEVVDGRRRVKMTPWKPVGKRRVRDFVMKRLTGKVEVELGEPLDAEPVTIQP